MLSNISSLHLYFKVSGNMHQNSQDILLLPKQLVHFIRCFKSTWRFGIGGVLHSAMLCLGFHTSTVFLLLLLATYSYFFYIKIHCCWCNKPVLSSHTFQNDPPIFQLFPPFLKMYGLWISSGHGSAVSLSWILTELTRLSYFVLQGTPVFAPNGC